MGLALWWEEDFDYVTFKQRPSSPHNGSKPCFQVRLFLTKAAKINKKIKYIQGKLREGQWVGFGIFKKN